MRTPALDLWRQELREGKRTPTTFDPVWKAACAEASALEFAAAGIPALADSFLADARRIIHEAAKRQRGSAA